MLLHISISHIVVMLAHKLNWLKILNQCMCNESSLGFRLLWIFTFRQFFFFFFLKTQFYCWDLNVTGAMKCNILFMRYYTETSPICHSSLVIVRGNQSEYFGLKQGCQTCSLRPRMGQAKTPIQPNGRLWNILRFL